MTMSNEDFIELRLFRAIRDILIIRVNKILEDSKKISAVIENGTFNNNYVINPIITLNGCEQTEKERILKLDTFLFTITFPIADMPEGELYCYGYANAFEKALNEDVTLGGVANRTVITNKIYTQPKTKNCGEGYSVSISLRVTVEGTIL